jgi:hypothetical protein
MYNELQKGKLKNTKYMYSKKSLRLKSIFKVYELTEPEIFKLKDTINKLDSQVIDKLVKQCLIKTIKQERLKEYELKKK